MCCLGHIDPRSNYDPCEEFHRSSLYPKTGFACCPQDDLYVITWETNLCDFTDFTTNELNLPNAANADNTSSPEDHSGPSEQYLTDVDLQSTGRDETEDFLLDQMTRTNDDELIPDDKASSGGSDTIVPEVLESENDEMIVEKVLGEENITFDLTLPPPSLIQILVRILNCKVPFLLSVLKDMYFYLGLF